MARGVKAVDAVEQVETVKIDIHSSGTGTNELINKLIDELNSLKYFLDQNTCKKVDNLINFAKFFQNTEALDSLEVVKGLDSVVNNLQEKLKGTLAEKFKKDVETFPQKAKLNF